MVYNIFMTYKDFALRMYSENCRERAAYNSAPYNSFLEYEKENRSFLKKKYTTSSWNNRLHRRKVPDIYGVLVVNSKKLNKRYKLHCILNRVVSQYIKSNLANVSIRWCKVIQLLKPRYQATCCIINTIVSNWYNRIKWRWLWMNSHLQGRPL